MKKLQEKSIITTKNIFDDLHMHIGCEYLSDIRCSSHIRRAKKMLRRYNLERYPLSQLNDIARYLFDIEVNFENHKQAKLFFGTR